MYKKSIYFTIISIGLLFGGCTASPKVKTKWVSKSSKYYDNRNNPIEFRYQPVIGTKQSDTKVMIDMGEWAKIWIKNYRNENKTFVASHSIVTMVREPGFIAGEQIPRKKRDAVYNTYGSRSFTFRSQDLTYDNSSYGNENVSDEQIKDYVNSYEYSKKTKRMKPQKRKEAKLYNSEIKKYIAEVRAKKQKRIDDNNEALRKDEERRKREKAEPSDAQYNSEDEYKYGSLK